MGGGPERTQTACQARSHCRTGLRLKRDIGRPLRIHFARRRAWRRQRDRFFLPEQRNLLDDYDYARDCKFFTLIRAALDRLLQLDLDVGSCHANVVSSNRPLRWRFHNRARPNVERGAMPGTRHFVARQLALSERAAVVSAGVVEREELAVDVEQSNLFALHIDQSSLAGLDLVCVRYFHKVSHLGFLRVEYREDQYTRSFPSMVKCRKTFGARLGRAAADRHSG